MIRDAFEQQTGMTIRQVPGVALLASHERRARHHGAAAETLAAIERLLHHIAPGRGPAFARAIRGAYERRSIGPASHDPFGNWGQFLPGQTTVTAMLDAVLHHVTVVIIRRRARPHARSKDLPHQEKEDPTHPREVGLTLATSGDFTLVVDIDRPSLHGWRPRAPMTRRRGG